PYFAGAHLLLAADCAAYAYGNFHRDFMQGRVTLIGCPKLDGVDYSDKLTAILQNNNIKSVTIVKMEVPCCAGLVTATQKALANCGKVIPWQYKILSLAGQVIED
ncbi:MAG: ferredoxin, partial [Acidaminococcaceae bacterium]